MLIVIVQSFFMPATYEFDLGLFRKSLAAMLDRQPIELMAVIDPLLIGPPEGAPPMSPREAAAKAARAAAAAAARAGQHQRVADVLLPKQPTDRMYAWRFQLLHEHLFNTKR